MKILHLIPNLNKGGAERIALDTCIALSKMPDKEIALVTFQEGNEYEFLSKQINHHCIPSHFTPSIFKASKYSVQQLQNFISHFKPDIIHCHLFQASMLLTQIDYSRDKTFIHFHDNIPQLSKLNWRNLWSKVTWTNFYERKVFVKFYSTKKTELNAVSIHTLNYIKTNLPNFKAHLLLNAIDLTRFTPNIDSFQSERIVMIGSFVTKKNQRLAITILSELHKTGKYFHLDLVGDGHLKVELEELGKQLGLADYIRFHGNIDFPVNVLSNAFIYLHTATYEPFGLTIVEAMASGLPVVCLNGQGNEILVHNGVNGYLLNTSDPNVFANKISELKVDKKLYNRISKNALEYSNKFSIGGYVERLVELYKEPNPTL